MQTLEEHYHFETIMKTLFQNVFLNIQNFKVFLCIKNFFSWLYKHYIEKDAVLLF